jgi:hypothetical protein
MWRDCGEAGRAAAAPYNADQMRTLTVPLSEAKENPQDLRRHRGNLAATTVRFAQPPFSTQLQRGLTGDAAFSLRSLAALDFRSK